MDRSPQITLNMFNQPSTSAAASASASRVPANGEMAEEWAYLPTKKEKRVVRSISDYPGVLRLPRNNFDVPTFDQLYRAEQMYLLRSYGFGCIEFSNKDSFKLLVEIEDKLGKCKLISFLKSRIISSRISHKVARATKKRLHAEQQAWWENGGQEATYLKNHRYGCTDHSWFANQLHAVTGMWSDVSLAPVEDWEDEQYKAAPIQAKRVRWSRTCEKSDTSQAFGVFNFNCKTFSIAQDWTPPSRNLFLLSRLRYYVAHLRNATRSMIPCHTFYDLSVEWKVAYPQSEGVETMPVQTVHTSNVVLTENDPSSSALASEKVFDFKWHKLCSTEKDVNYTYLTDRFTLFKTFTWTKDQTKGSVPDASATKPGATYDLPCDFVNKTDGSVPMFVPFKIHRYFKSDIEIKIHVNSNKFQIGQLMFSWSYMQAYDGNPLSNMYTRSQLPHVLINAGSSNEATLYIPYKNIHPFMTTSQRNNDVKCNYLGNLKCQVVVPLSVPDNGPSSANVSIFIRLPNAEFTGMTDGSITYPQMEAAATAMVAAAVVDKVIGDRNCDNPSENIQPKVLVPTATHSWSAGTGTSDHVQSLRLDHSVNSVGRKGIGLSETSIGIPCRTFGMLRHVEWSTVTESKNKSGAQLWSCDVHAQIEKRLMYEIDNPAGLNQYAAPPVTVVSSMYKYWRGSLEFKFDIIASQFHTGRLLVAYIPGFYGDASKITIDQARNCPCIEFSLGEASSFTFVVPYISDSVWWTRKYTGPQKLGENTAPSKIVMFILNPLIPMEAIVNTVTIVPYVRAGEDFEVCVPVQPAVGLSDNPSIKIPNRDKLQFDSKWLPMYCTNSNKIGESKKYVMYNGTAAFGRTVIPSIPNIALKDNQYVYYEVIEQNTCGDITYYDPVTKQNKTEFIGWFTTWADPAGALVIPYPKGTYGEQQAKKVAQLLRKGEPPEQILSHVITYVQDGLPSVGTATTTMCKAIVKNFDEVGVDSEDEWVRPEMDPRFETVNNLMPTNSLPSTSCGQFPFNEDFSDLKTLGRRYQLYSSVSLNVPREYNSSSGLVRFPVVPRGLSLDTSVEGSTSNICRDGHIPIISSGFVFFRGSIRLRMTLASDSAQVSGGQVWIQHHPDGKPIPHSIQKIAGFGEADKMQCHSYGFYVQAVRVNNTLEVEIPFYQDGMYGLCLKLRTPPEGEAWNVDQYYSLGNVVIGADLGKVSKAFDVSGKIYYSLGDDFSFNVWRGFPVVVFTDEVWVDAPAGVAQMEEVQVDEIGDPQMFKAVQDYIFKPVRNFVKEEITESIKDIIHGIKVDYIKSKIKVKSDIDLKFSLINEASVAAALTGLMHVLINPQPKTIAISIAGVIVSIIGHNVLVLAQLVYRFTQFLNSAWCRFTEGNVPQNEKSNVRKEALSVCGMIFSALASMVDCVVSPPKKYPDLLAGINSKVSLANNVQRFLENTGNLLPWCIEYITSKLFPRAAFELKIANDIPEIKAWYEECVYLLSVTNKRKFLYDKVMFDRVFDAVALGNILVANGINDSHPAGKVICDTLRDLKKLQTDLYERGAHPDVRFEPFPIWITGPPGIGKSFLVSHLSNHLLRSVNCTQSGSLIYTIPPGANFWSGCDNPAVLVSDDLFQVNGPKMQEEISNIFNICSSCVLNPPMADLQDKNKRINPLLYIMLCNRAFPTLSPTCNTPEAVYRRRRWLIEADFTDEIRAKYPNIRDASQCTPEELANQGHLKFRYAYNVKSNDQGEGNWSQWWSYNEMINLVQVSFQRHYESERQNFRGRMRQMYSLDPNFEEENIISQLPDIEYKTGLKAQMEFIKSLQQDKLDDLNDPNHEKTNMEKIGDKIREYWPSADPQNDPVDVFKNNPQVEHVFNNLLAGKSIAEAAAAAIPPDENATYHCNFATYYPDFHAQFGGMALAITTHDYPSPVREIIDELSKLTSFQCGFLNEDDNVEIKLRVASVYTALTEYPVNDNPALNIYKNMLSCITDMDLPLLDMLRSMLMFYDGPEVVARLLYSNEFVVDKSAIRKPEMYESVELCDWYNSSTKHEKQLQMCALKTNCCYDVMRKYIQLNQFRENKSLGSQFLHASLMLLRLDILDVCSDMDMKVVNEFVDIVHRIAVSETYANQHVILVDLVLYCVNLSPSVTKSECKLLFGFVVKVIARMAMARTLAYDDHKCSVRSVYDKLGKNVKWADVVYCDKRVKLSVCGVDVKMCDKQSCVYSNRVTWAKICMSASGCLRYNTYSADNIEKDADADRLFDSEWKIFGVWDLQCDNMKKKFNGELTESRFKSLQRYVSHVVFDVIPTKFTYILAFIMKHFKLIICVLGVVRLISCIFYDGHISSPFIHAGEVASGAAQTAFDWARRAECPKLLKNVGACVGGAGMGYMFDNLADRATDYYTDKQGNYFKFDKAKHHTQPNVKIPGKHFNVPQMSASARVIIGDKIVRNFVRMHVSWVEDGKRETRGCNCLMIRGRTMLVLRHYIEEYKYLIDNGKQLEIKLLFLRSIKTQETAQVSITWDDLSNIAWCSNDGDVLSSNFGLVVLPPCIIQFPCIVNKFATETEHSNMPSKCDMYTLGGENSFDMPINKEPRFVVSPSPTSTEVRVVGGYSYVRQKMGLCGSVLVAPSLGSGAGAIVGIHVAGSPSSGKGFSEPIYREMFLKFFDIHKESVVMPLPVTFDNEPDFELDSNLLMYGTVDPKFAHRESGKTKIVPSLLHDQIYVHKTEPNPLKPDDPRQPPGSHPLRDGCNKHGMGNVSAYEPQMVEQVRVDLSEKLSAIIRPVRAEVKPLTLQQAICGDTIPYFESLNWKSSEGFPLSASRPKTATDKRWLFDLEQGQFGYVLKSIHPKLSALLKLRDRCFSDNIKPITIYTDCLKDYRLTPKKCAEPGKTRIFSVAPVQCSIDIRMYLTDFTASLKNSRIRNGIGIGINPDSMEWTDLVNYLFEVGNNIITLDYKNFGPSLMSQLVAAGNKIIVDWHEQHGASPDHVKRVEWLLDSDILNPVHLSSNLVYQTINGIASGSPLTGECNSIPNLMYIRLTYMECMKENCPEFASMYYFNHFVRLVVYGDDLIMSVDDTIKDIFNALTIKYYLGLHGIQVTPAAKDSEMVPYTTIYEATFLKRGFVQHPTRSGVWLAPVETQSVEECLNWCHVSEDIAGSTLECCRASLDLAYGHGPVYYNNHRNKINQALRKLDLVLNSKTWHQRDSEIFDESLNDPIFNNKMPWFYNLNNIS